ncbi:hypothetical protein AAKU55_003925 [Oxalobacteraceae bacterium GrIS 1.11]
MYKFPGIPSVSSRVPAEVGALLRPMREILTSFTSGDTQVATVAALRRAGLLGGVNGDGTLQPAIAFDATPPPAPGGLSSGGALASIILGWDTTTYANLSHTEIWRAQTNDFSLAQLVGRGDGRIYVDSVGGAAVRYYWIRYISRANVPGPFNAQAGVRGETGVDAGYLLSVMRHQITESQLYGALGARINLIDAPENTPGSVAQRIAAVSSQSGSNTAAVQAEASTRATQTGELYAQYTVKADVNGYVSGYGLASTAKGAAPTSSFAVRADTFYIANPSGPGIAPSMPFLVRTTATTINGVAVPIGVYIADAFIANGTITNAKIGDAAIDNAKIASLDAGKITTGYMDAARIHAGSLDAKIANLDTAVITSGFIDRARINNASIANVTIGNAQITNLDAGKISSGFIDAARIQVGSFDAKIANITTAQIANATITNAQIAGDISSTNWVYGVAGWYLSRSGALYANSGEFRGSLVGADGTFNGRLTARNAVITDNIVANGISSVDIFPSGITWPMAFVVDGDSKVLIIFSAYTSDTATDHSRPVGITITNSGGGTVASATDQVSANSRATAASLAAGTYFIQKANASTIVTFIYILKVMK